MFSNQQLGMNLHKISIDDGVKSSKLFHIQKSLWQEYDVPIA
jgi:hypothetical protein